MCIATVLKRNRKVISFLFQSRHSRNFATETPNTASRNAPGCAPALPIPESSGRRHKKNKENKRALTPVHSLAGVDGPSNLNASLPVEKKKRSKSASSKPGTCTHFSTSASLPFKAVPAPRCRPFQIRKETKKRNPRTKT